MAYAEGTATDQFDLLGKIYLFLSSNGYTTLFVSDSSTYSTGALEGSSSSKRLHAYKDSRSLNFRSTSGAAIIPTYTQRRYGIGFNLGTSYNETLGWANQAGVTRILSSSLETPAFCWCNGAVSYKMFLWDDPFTFLVYIKHSETMLSQIYFSEISTKYGSWDGGNIFLSSWDNSSNSINSSYSVLNSSFLSPNLSFNTTGSVGGYFTGALKFETTGVISSGNTWATRGTPNDGDSADALFLPYCGWPMSHGSSITSKSYEYLANGYMDCLLHSLPAAFTSPIVLLPIQPALIRSTSTLRCSLLGELPYLKMTAGPTSLQEQIVTYDGAQYMLLQLGIPLAYSNGNYINTFLAVEYEGS